MFINSLKRSLVAAGILLSIWAAANAQQQPQKPAPSPEARQSEVGRITVDELKTKLENGEPVLIIDARSQSTYNWSDKQIKGAVRIDPSYVESHLKDLPKGKDVVVYCT
jgi:hypothetical protein